MAWLPGGRECVGRKGFASPFHLNIEKTHSKEKTDKCQPNSLT
jgi:hypothetical protein